MNQHAHLNQISGVDILAPNTREQVFERLRLVAIAIFVALIGALLWVGAVQFVAARFSEFWRLSLPTAP